MNPHLLSALRCPRCRGPLTTVDDPPEALRCASCEGGDYPIVAGIPRLTTDPYAGSFGRQWNRYDVMREEEDEETFEVKTGIPAASLAGKLVLDAGCGGGRYSRLVGSHGARVLGVDLSSAVEKARALCDGFPDVLIAQADLLDLAVADESFDMAFSIGVMHHTPDPRHAFAQVARKVKRGGRLAVWLYRKNTPPQEWINSGLRAVSTRLPARVLEPICAATGVLGSVPIVNRTLNKLVNFSAHPDWTLRVCDNFDWYAPRYQSHHTLFELLSWFDEEGFDDLIELTPAKRGPAYDWAYGHDLIIGSGVNVAGTKR